MDAATVTRVTQWRWRIDRPRESGHWESLCAGAVRWFARERVKTALAHCRSLREPAGWRGEHGRSIDRCCANAEFLRALAECRTIGVAMRDVAPPAEVTR